MNNLSISVQNQSVSLNTVAQYFNVSTRTIRVWMEKDDNFPRPFKRYNTLMFNLSKIEDYWFVNTRK